MERRQFLITLALGGASLVALTGKKAFAQESVPSVPLQNIQVVISRNHGHALVMAESDLKDGAAHSYDITGESSHPHTVELGPEHFAALLQGQSVQVQSSTDAGHSHTVTLTLQQQPA